MGPGLIFIIIILGLPHKGAERDANGNLKSFVPPDTSNLISMVLFTFHTRRHLIPLAS